jgi:hypothetical protein
VRFSKRSALPAALVALSLTLAACGGDEEKPEAEEKSSAPAPEVPQIWPFTGLEAAEGESVELDRPPLVVKIPNTNLKDTQLGLGKADLVVEQMVEGRTSRLAAIFYSQLPKEVGPVRSLRATDIGIAAPINAVVVASGGAPQTNDRLKKEGVKFVGEGSDGYYRKNGRTAPYNLFADLTKVAKAAEDGKEERPVDYLPWGTAAELPAGKPAGTIAADFGNHTTNWAFQGGKYVNKSTFAAKGDQFQADSVLTLRVDVVDAGYTDAANNPVPESRFVGKGKAQLFHAGNVIEGTWSKAKPGSPLELTTPAGPLKVPAGKVWIELVPVDAKGGSVTFGE